MIKRKQIILFFQSCLFLTVFTNLSVQAQDKKVTLKIGILRFENLISPKKITSSHLGLYSTDPQYDYLEKALADMLYTDIAQKPDVELVERGKVEKLLDEIKFDESGLVDEKTVQEAGKALLADYLIFGHIKSKKGKIVLRTKIHDVAAKKYIELEPIADFEKNIFRLEKELYKSIYKTLQISSENKIKNVKIKKNSALAILPFNNNSKTNDLDYLRSSLSELLASGLVNYKIFKLVEREKINKIIKELTFQQSGICDEKTALQIGRLLGAKYILLGSFIQVGDIIRIDARLSAVETGEILQIAKTTGDKSKLFELQEDLKKQIIKGIK